LIVVGFFLGPGSVAGTLGSLDKAGSKKMTKSSKKKQVCAGVDVGKTSLSYAVAGASGAGACTNTASARKEMIAHFSRAGVTRVGMESTGAYHFAAAEELREAGFEVLVFQPMQVKAYAKFRLKRAKSDPIDAALIARCAEDADDPPAQSDPRFIALAERLTFIDQISEDIARAKVRRERYRDPDLLAKIDGEIKAKTMQKRQETKRLVAAVRDHKDLARRLHLLLSIQGVGEPTALALLIRMPELGRLTREEAASLIGAAPFVKDSGQAKGRRRTSGGRARARTSLFAAAQVAARRWNPALIAFYDRLTANGKPHALAIMACVRKLTIFANTILAADRPWEIRQPAT
jgi:transposase